MENNLKFNAWFTGEKLGKFDTLKEAQQIIKDHENYKKSLFTKKGKATSKNKEQKQYFAIYDTQGYGWTI